VALSPQQAGGSKETRRTHSQSYAVFLPTPLRPTRRDVLERKTMEIDPLRLLLRASIFGVCVWAAFTHPAPASTVWVVGAILLLQGWGTEARIMRYLKRHFRADR